MDEEVDSNDYLKVDYILTLVGETAIHLCLPLVSSIMNQHLYVPITRHYVYD